jgi:WD40 repeat protein
MNHVHQRIWSAFAPNALASRAVLIALLFHFLEPASLGQTNESTERSRLRIVGQESLRLSGEAAGGRVHDLAFSPVRDSTVCAIAMDGAVQVWELTGKPKMVTRLTPPVPSEFQTPGAEATPHPISLSYDGSRLAVAYFGIQIWDFGQRKLLFAVPMLWTPEAIRFTGLDNSLVVACSFHGSFKVPSDTPGKIQVFSRNMYERTRVNDPSNFEIFKGSWLERRGGTDPPEMGDSYCLAVFPDSKRFAAGGASLVPDRPRVRRSEPSVKVWDIGSGRPVIAIGDKERPIVRFCLSPDGRTLYSCGGMVLGWDATKSTPPIKTFLASSDRTVSVAVSPNGKMLGAGALDGTVVIWDADSALRLATITHSGGAVYCLAFSPDSGKLVAAGERGVATVWDIKLMPKEHN